MVQSDGHRVVVTGLGVASPLGHSPDALFNALLAEQSSVQLLEGNGSDRTLPTRCTSTVKDFTGRIDDFGSVEGDQKKSLRKGIKLMCREIQLGVAAAQRALADAQICPSDYDPDRRGVIFGSDYMMSRPEDFVDGVRQCSGPNGKFQFDRWGAEGLHQVGPLWLLKYLPNMPASHIAIYNDFRGPSNSITLRESSSNLSLAEAYCILRRGAADLMIAGATGTRIHPMRQVHVATQEEIAHEQADPARMSRPFDLNRTGMVLGEGAGAVILERFESAQRRNATIYAEIVGYGSSSVLQSGSIARHSKALENAIIMSLRNGNTLTKDVGHIHAHGLSTRNCDAEEARAIHKIFGERNKEVPVVAAKSSFGNLGAGSGTVELIASVKALQNNRLFSVLNFETPDPSCPVSVIRPGETQPAGHCFLNLNVTPQGQASALLVRKCA